MRKSLRGASGPVLVVVAASVLALGALALAPEAQGADSSMRVAAGLSTNYDFARLVLADGGWPASVNNTTALTQWLRAEEPTSRWWNRDNPLNNGLGSGGGSGLGSYRSVVIAASEVARNLENPAYGYPLVARDLAGSAPPSATARAIWRSSWAAGHYGQGADWDTSPVPSVAAPAVVWRDPAECPAAYSRGEVGPCGRGFSATGSAWRSGAPGGVEGDELWALSSESRTAGHATWRPGLAPGHYSVAAYVPAAFADAVVTYVVVDARGGHKVVVNQEPYRNAWVPLGVFRSTTAAPLVVRLGTSSSSGVGTYVAADAMRFEHVSANPARTAQRPAPPADPRPQRPGPPQDVAAVAADGSALVSWLPPSKDGGVAVSSYTATALPGGQTCRVVAQDGQPSCSVRGIVDGRSYDFIVRATNRRGTGVRSAASSAVRPVHASTVTLLARPRPLFGKRILFRAVISPPPATGVVLFALDGTVLRGCQSARLVRGHASCATRLKMTGHHEMLATFSGSQANGGAEAAVPLLVARAPTSLRASPTPRAAQVLAIMTLHAWGLPNQATGEVRFVSGASRLCVSGVRAGVASCSFRLRLSPGAHLIDVTYSGNRQYLGAKASTSLRVLPTPTG